VGGERRPAVAIHARRDAAPPLERPPAHGRQPPLGEDVNERVAAVGDRHAPRPDARPFVERRVLGGEVDVAPLLGDHGECLVPLRRGAGIDHLDVHRAHGLVSTKRLITSESSRVTPARPSTMRGAAWPSPYGLEQPFSVRRVSGASARWIASRIASTPLPQSMTLAPRTRPRCRMPTLTAGSSNDGASMSPLDELPTSASTCA